MAACAIAYILAHRYTPSLAVGTPAPLDDTITLVSNNSLVALKNFKKPLVINFWATWCGPCRQELPLLARLSKKFHNQVTFIGAAVDSPRADIQSVKNTLSLNYTLAEAPSQTIKNWHAELLPTTYIINSKGIISFAHTGLINEYELIEALDALLKK